MINKLSNFIVYRYILNGTEQIDEIEVYQFALFIIISNICFFIICLLAGLVFTCVIEMIIFFITFQLLRAFAGGYHAKSETVCELATTSSIVLVGFINFFAEKMNFIRLFLLAASIVSAMLILIFSPIETNEKPLNIKERKKYRMISLIILFSIILSVIITSLYKLSIIYIPCCLSLILESILLTIGKVSNVFSHER